MHIDEIQFREGRLEDCDRIAELDDMASGGAIDFLFHDLIPGLTPVQIVAKNFERDEYPFTFKSAIVARHGQRVVGYSLSFPAEFHTITDEMRHFFPPERLAHFHDFFSSRVEGSFYLDGLGVEPGYQRYGIGRRLIDLTKEKGKAEGYSALSLIVFADNIQAIKLYERCGFQAVKPIELNPHERIPHQGGCLLMNSALEGPGC